MLHMQIPIFVLAVIAFLISIIFAIKQSLDSKRSDSVLAFIELFSEFRSDKLVKAREMVNAELKVELYNPSQGFRDLPDDLREKALLVSHFFDHLGALDKRDYLLFWHFKAFVHLNLVCAGGFFPFVRLDVMNRGYDSDFRHHRFQQACKHRALP